MNQGSTAATLVREVRLPATDPPEPGPVALELRIDFGIDPVRLELSGDLCPYTVPFVDDELRILERSEARELWVDLSRLEFLSHDAVHMLAEHSEIMAAAGARLRVLEPSRPARRVFELCEAERLIDWSASDGGLDGRTRVPATPR